MRAENFESGILVSVDRCQFQAILLFVRFESADLTVDPGVGLIESVDYCVASPPYLNHQSPEALGRHAPILSVNFPNNWDDEKPEPNGHLHDRHAAAFTDEPSLEKWLTRKLLPSLAAFRDENGDPKEDAAEMIATATRMVMNKVAVNMAVCATSLTLDR